MNPLVKNIGLAVIIIIGIAMIIAMIIMPSPSNAFLLFAGLSCIIGLIIFIVINRHFEK